MKPQFEHDCPTCVLLGQSATHDFYYHAEGMKTVLARFGSEGPDYESGLPIARSIRGNLDFYAPLAQALTLAEEQGFVKRLPAISIDNSAYDAITTLFRMDSLILDNRLMKASAARYQASMDSLTERINRRLREKYFAVELTPQLPYVIEADLNALLKDAIYNGEVRPS